MMKCVALALALLASASAFVPSSPLATRAARTSSVVKMAVEDMPGVLPPMGFFDPAGISKGVSPEGLAWYRAAELKHGRVAMLANAGFMTVGAGIHFPGYLSITDDMTFASLGTKPLDAWANMPSEGKQQIVGYIAILEIAAECIKPHYTKGGPGWVLDPFGFASSLSPEELKVKQTRELQNGRLAMIGAMGFSAAASIPGSVPFLADKII